MLHVRDQEAVRGEAPTAAGSPAAVPRQRGGRDPYFDNAKYLAVVLVAVGHAWGPLMGESRTVTALYMAVYTFHMPAFVLIAGYFSRGFTGRPDQVRRLIAGVGVPYLVFETAYILFHRQVHDEAYPFSLLDPYYVTWFLIALFVWRLSAPLWRAVRWPLPVSVVIAVLATVSPHLGDDLNIQRVFQLLPFFVLGMLLEREHLEKLRQPAVRALAVPVALGALVVAYWAAPRVSHQWFYRSNAVQELGQPWWTGPGIALVLLAVGAVVSAAFLAWVPTRTTWYSALGTGTLYGFLLHGFLAKGSRWWGWYDPEWLHTPAGYLVVTAAGAVIVTLLCTEPVRRVLRPLVEPSLGWAFRSEPLPPNRGRT